MPSGLRTIALMNQKGGVGKTTTTVNLAVGMARAGQRVLAVDLDPQAHTSTHLGVTDDAERPCIYDVLVHNADLAGVCVPIEDNLTLVPSGIDLAAAELELSAVVAREMILRDALATVAERHDVVLIDCPPSLGVLTLNGLTAATEVLVPLQPHFFPLHGLGKLFETVQLVSARLNPRLRVSGVVMCMFETGTRLSTEVLGDLRDFLATSKETGAATPWRDAVVLPSFIRRNIKLAEAASFGRSIFDYEPNCNGARDYAALTRQVLALRSADQPETSPAVQFASALRAA